MMSVGVDFPKDIYKALKSKEKDNPTTDGGETDSTTTGDGSSTRGLLNTSTDNVSVISQSSSTTDGQQKSSPDKDKPLPSPPASLGLMPGPANADGKKTPTSPGQGYNFPMETLEKALVAGSSIGRIVEAGLKCEWTQICLPFDIFLIE